MSGLSQKIVSLEAFIPDLLKETFSDHLIFCRASSELKLVARTGYDHYTVEMKQAKFGQQTSIFKLLLKGKNLKETGEIKNLFIPDTVVLIGNQSVTISGLNNPSSAEINDYIFNQIPNAFQEIFNLSAGLTRNDMIQAATARNIGNLTDRTKPPILQISGKPIYNLSNTAYMPSSPLSLTPTVNVSSKTVNDGSQGYLL